MFLRSPIFKYLSLLVCWVLSGCSEKRVPVGPVCVSCNPYYCRGSWHYPQKHYHYDKVGIASWYGHAFHGKLKASGQPFDMYSMTAAHKTLPLPSVVRVTNLQTGKSIIVVVDDRGPYVYKGRIIDLSYRAAQALGIHNKGIANVRVQCLQEESQELSRLVAKYRKRKQGNKDWYKIYLTEIAGRKKNTKSQKLSSIVAK